LDKLRKKQTKHSPTLESEDQKWVHNLSSLTLSNSQVSRPILKKGFKFAIAQNLVFILDFVSGVEFGLHQIEDSAQVLWF